MISVVIPAYNEERTVAACLNSFLHQTTKKEFEILFVNNASTDRTVAVAKSFSKKLPLRIINEPQKGRGKARKTGFHHAKGTIILSTDCDTTVPPTWLEDMTSPFQNKNIDAVAGSYTVSTWPKHKQTLLKAIYESYMHLYWLVFAHFPLTGFNFAVTKRAYDKTSGFDETMTAAEDVDITFKIKRVGKIVYKRVPVFVDPRRYERGAFKCLYDYARTDFNFFLDRKQRISLDDIR